MAYLQFLFVCVVWGSSFILMKKAVLVFSPLAVGIGRVAGGAIVLWALWLIMRQSLRLRASDRWSLLFVSGLGYAWPYALQPFLVELYGSAFIGMLVGFVPLLTVLVSIPMLGVYPTVRQVVGVCGALVCLMGLMVDGLRREIPISHLLLAGTVPLSYAITNTYIRRSLSHVPTLGLSAASLFVTTVVLLPALFVVPVYHPTPTGDFATGVRSLFLLGVVGTGFATYVFNRMIQVQGPLFAGMVTNLIPVGAMLWGWSDAESISTLQVACLAGLFLMVILVQVGSARKNLSPPELVAAAGEEGLAERSGATGLVETSGASASPHRAT